MPSLLIVDPSKSSVVMTSEIFKDKVVGVSVQIAKSGQEGLGHLEQRTFDLLVVDFDLPDADGVTFAKIARKVHKGPILITAFPSPEVEKAIKEELFGYEDISAWIKKPVKADELMTRINKFLVTRRRIQKRFVTDIKSEVVAGQGKAPKIKGKIVNLSLGGAMVKCDAVVKAKVGQEVAVFCDFTSYLKSKEGKKAKAASSKSSGEASKKSKTASQEKEKMIKLKATVAWSGKQKIGLSFRDLPEATHREIEDILRVSKEWQVDG